jgi:hypothetical protein
MPRVRFKRTIPAFEQAKRALERVRPRGHCDRHYPDLQQEVMLCGHKESAAQGTGSRERSIAIDSLLHLYILLTQANMKCAQISERFSSCFRTWCQLLSIAGNNLQILSGVSINFFRSKGHISISQPLFFYRKQTAKLWVQRCCTHFVVYYYPHYVGLEKYRFLDDIICWTRKRCFTISYCHDLRCGTRDGVLDYWIYCPITGRKTNTYNSPTHGADRFLRRWELFSYSRTSQQFMEPEYLLPCSQEPSTGPYPEPDQFNASHLIPFL